MDGEIEARFIELRRKANQIKNFDSLLPADVGSIHTIVHWIAYFVNPTWADLDCLTAVQGISLTNDEKEAIYPLIIDFVLFVKTKFRTA